MNPYPPVFVLWLDCNSQGRAEVTGSMPNEESESTQTLLLYPFIV